MRNARLFLSVFLLLSLGISALGRPAAAQAQVQADPASDYRRYPSGATRRADPDKPFGKRQAEEAEAQTAETACEAGDLSGCVNLGKAYEFGAGREQNRPIAAVLYTQACDGGLGDGCARLGMLTSIATDAAAQTDAIALYEKACTMGSLEGCTQVALGILVARDDRADQARAEALLRDVCDKGGQSACRELGRMLLPEERGEASRSEGLRLLDRACKAGDLESCEALLRFYPGPQPHPDQPPRAQTMYDACTIGSGWHCEQVAQMALAGVEMAQDIAFAQAAFDRACAVSVACDEAEILRAAPALNDRCQAGDMAACATLGINHHRRLPSLIDDRRATQLLEMACLANQGHVCPTAADRLQSGPTGGDRSDAAIEQRSLRLIERGCDLRDVTSCYRLAEELLYGEAITQDKPRAYAIYADQCEVNWQAGCERISHLSAQDPDAPILTADAGFLPPLEEDGSLPDEFAQAPQDVPDSCTASTLMFRGKEYTDLVCSPVAIVGNGTTVQFGEAPWQALLWRPEKIGTATLSAADRVLCGGSLIQTGWILTAAHCLIDEGRKLESYPGYRVRLGVLNARKDEGVSYPIMRVFQHPFYSLRGYVFDVALVKYDTTKPVRARTFQPFRKIEIDPLSVTQRKITNGMPAYTYGWGWTKANNSTSSDALLSGKLTLQDLDTCTGITGLEGSLLHAQLCGVGVNGQQACDGDSGGPLIYYNDTDRRPKVIGVVSAGPKAADRKCGGKGDPSRYTRVGRVRDWIDQTIRSNR